MAGYVGRILLELTDRTESGRPVLAFLEPIRWGVVRLNPGDYTDGASVRWWLTGLIPCIARQTILVCADHDQQWRRRHARLAAGRRARARTAIDRRFHRLLRRAGVSAWRAGLMWAGVRFQAWMTGDHD